MAKGSVPENKSVLNVFPEKPKGFSPPQTTPVKPAVINNNTKEIENLKEVEKSKEAEKSNKAIATDSDSKF